MSIRAWYDVFLSYTREDRTLKDLVASRLRAVGVQPWIDDHLEIGTDWQRETAEAICRCDALVLVLTARSARSTWVRTEIELAKSRGLPIFPIRLDQEPIGAPMELALGLLQRFEVARDPNVGICAFAQEVGNALEKLAKERVGAMQGDAPMSPRMARILGEGLIEHVHTFDRGFQLLQQAAHGGHSQAGFRLGMVHYEGRKRNETEAFRHMNHAANLGLARAQSFLGYFFEKGIGVPQDVVSRFS